MLQVVKFLPRAVFLAVFVACLPLPPSVWAAAPARELPDWGESGDRDIFFDYDYVKHPGSSDSDKPNIVGSFLGRQSVHEIMKAGGAAPKGKLLICVSSAPVPGEASSQEIFDYRAMNMAPESVSPKTLEEIEYVLHVRYSFTDVRGYVSGARGLRPNAAITLTHLPTKKTMSSTTLEGSPPPERPRIFREGQRVHFGSSPALAKIAQAYARCLAMAAGRISGDFGYIVRNGNAALVYYSGNTDRLAIPATMDGYAVTAVESRVFNEPDEKRLVSVSIPPSIQRIGKFAFYECTTLARVNFSEGLKEIGEGAFAYAGLESLVLPSSLERIGDAAFADCKTLMRVTFPDTLKEMGRSAFSYTGLEALVLPSSLERIETYAFAGCAALKTVRLTEGATSIGKGAFARSYALKEIFIPASVTDIADDAFSGIKPPPFIIRR